MLTLQSIEPLRPADINPDMFHRLFMSSTRTRTGQDIPPYFIVYFLLVDLLGFPNNGRWEKTAWSVTVQLEETPFLIDHRKFGLGIFGLDGPDLEAKAAQVATCLKRAAKVARPYFDWRAETAANQSHLNVVNRSRDLLEHVRFHLELYEKRIAEADTRKGESVKTQVGPNAWTTHLPALELRVEAKHFAIAAIEGFFSWTEHVFIHIAILRGALSTGKEVGDLAKAEWTNKYKAALDLNDPADKRFFDDLVEMRRQFRNFVAHGSFGKDGEAFQFHSNAGAVPMLLPHRQGNLKYRFGNGLDLRFDLSITLIKSFINHLWTGERSPAKFYIEDYQLPAILTLVANGEYAEAMRSDASMKHFAEQMAHRMDNAANMDF